MNRDELYDRIGYRFKDEDLLKQVLIHPSMTHAHSLSVYERCEFVGDRVLSLVIAEILYKIYPNDDEGLLSQRHTALVRRDAIAQVARSLNLSRFFKVSRDRASRESVALLADGCEALIGAIYIDGGLAPAHQFIKTHWQSLIEDTSHSQKDAKTALQEWAQGRGLPLPTYTLIDANGPAHAQQFTVEVSVATGLHAQGSGSSKQRAQQAAAQALLAEVISS